MYLTPTAFIFLGIVALSVSAGTVTRTVDARVGGMLASILWFVWGVNAFRVVSYTNAGEPIVHHWDALAFVGMGLGVLFLLDWILVWFHEADVDLGKYARI